MLKKILLLLGCIAVVLLTLTAAAPAINSKTIKTHKVHIFHKKGFAQQPATTPNNIPYHGGPVMGDVAHAYAIYWEPAANVSTDYNSLIERYLFDVGGSPLYKNNTQYPQADSVHPTNAILSGEWADDQTAYPHSPLLDTDIQAEVARAQQANGGDWATTTDNDTQNVYFVFTEKNEGMCVDSTQTECTPDITSSTNASPFCAYHSTIPGTNAIYAAMPYAASPNFGSSCSTGSFPNNDDADQTINVTSHEQMEAATDPQVNAWIDNGNTNGGEIGDMCAWTFGPKDSQGADVVWNSNSYIVQKEWSNAIGGCTLSAPVVPPPPTHYWNKLVNHNSGLVADVYGGGKNAGAHVIQWTNHHGLNQQWFIYGVATS
jgi:hypothetical protein